MLLEQEKTADYCLPSYFSKVVLLFGPFFHLLNAFWFYKIVRKVVRKMSGREKLMEKNDLTESGDLAESIDLTESGHLTESSDSTEDSESTNGTEKKKN